MARILLFALVEILGLPMTWEIGKIFRMLRNWQDVAWDVGCESLRKKTPGNSQGVMPKKAPLYYPDRGFCRYGQNSTLVLAVSLVKGKRRFGRIFSKGVLERANFRIWVF